MKNVWLLQSLPIEKMFEKGMIVAVMMTIMEQEMKRKEEHK